MKTLSTIDISLFSWEKLLDKLHVLMQRFSRVITDINAIESEFREFQITLDDGFRTYFDMDDKPLRIDHICHQIS